ncbi:MAG: molybdopterin-dependent oxidoreductase, partial [Pseudomonadota bacterium]
FHLIAQRYLAGEYAPEAVAETVGIPAERIRGLAAELADVAFEQAIELDRPWTDFRGQTHQTMIGRPVSMHAMRGISAHANGFQTCRALHLLQILLGAVETPGSFRFKPPYPRPTHGHPKPHATATPGKPLAGPHLGYPHGPKDLCLHEDGSPQRIDKAYTWENPMSAHGLMHMVISNAVAGDPYRIDTLFLYMANMSWNSSMNTRATMDMLTAQDEDGTYKIPHIIYSDAYSSEMVAYADLILPDTTYLERHDCISLLDRPISDAERAADAIRWPVVEPDRDVRGFQSVLCDLGHRLGLPGFVNDNGGPKFKDYADYITHHERRPGVGPLSGWRGNGEEQGRGAPNPSQLDRYIRNGGYWTAEIPHEAEYYKPWNAAYQDWAVEIGLCDKPAPYIFDLYSEPLRRFQMAAEGKGDIQPPEHLRARIRERLDPLPIWYPTAEADETYTIHALTQRPMAMYHSWGTQNAWLRQIHGTNPLYVPTKLWEAHGFDDGSGVAMRSACPRNGTSPWAAALARGSCR